MRLIKDQMSKKNGLANPTRLKPFDSDDKQMLRVLIETPKGSRNKFAFDPDEHIFELCSSRSFQRPKLVTGYNF